MVHLVYCDNAGKKGEKVFIKRFFGNVEQCVLYDRKGPISPIVSNITYDEEHGVFLVRDEYRETYEDGTYGLNRANVYFYIDFAGNPIGMGYSDASNGMFNVTTREDYENFHDHWFLAYGNFKKELGISYAKQLASHRKHYNECAKKMLILHENKK